MTTPKSKTSYYERDEYDWYVEPDWSVYRLLDRIRFVGPIYDPACGGGNIILCAQKRGYEAIGTDIVSRAGEPDWWRGRVDFLEKPDEMRGFYSSIITNPPYTQAEEFARLALPRVQHKLAMITRLDWLASQIRYHLFTEHPPSDVFVMSKRPSMPPGWQTAPAKGGQHDYCWVVWDVTKPDGHTSMSWLI